MQLHRLHLLELANAALNLSRLARFRPETPNELLEVFLFLFEVLRAVLEKLPLFLALQEIPLVVSSKRPNAFRLEADDSVHLLVEELPIVGDEKKGLVVAAQKLREPCDRRHVQVVRRLVEEQQPGPLKQEGRQHGAHLPATTQLGQETLVVVLSEAEPVQNLLGVMLRKLRIEHADLFVKLCHGARHGDQLIVVGVAVVLELGQSRFVPLELRAQLRPAGHTVVHEGQHFLVRKRSDLLG